MNMKKLIAKLQTFFLSMTLVDDCWFERGLQIRRKPTHLAAAVKFPAR